MGFLTCKDAISFPKTQMQKGIIRFNTNYEWITDIRHVSSIVKNIWLLLKIKLCEDISIENIKIKHYKVDV